MADSRSFQQRLYPDLRCFGCGPANEKGLRINSFPTSDRSMVADWIAGPEHQAGGPWICGGVLGTILDCHTACTVIHTLMMRDPTLATPPVLFTKEYTIRFRNPTPLGPVRVTATVTDLRQRSASAQATVESEGRVCVEFTGIFVLPQPDEVVADQAIE